MDDYYRQQAASLAADRAKPRGYADKNNYLEGLVRHLVDAYPDECFSFNSLRAKIRSQGLRRLCESGEPGGNLLKLVRKMGIISPEIDSRIVAYIRAGLMDAKLGTFYKVDMDGNFIQQIRALAAKEKGDPQITSDLFAAYGKLAPGARVIEQKADSGTALTADENEQRTTFEDSQRKLDRQIPPLAMFLHFYDNGDLKWLWGLKETDTVRTVLQDRSEGGRVGDPDNEWW